MKLPDYPRVIYQRNPLIEVVCQLRFPTILKIKNQDPFEFQDKIYEDYPIYKKYSPSFSKELEEIENLLSETSLLSLDSHKFNSDDGKWQISLNQNFLSLATLQYERFEEFEARLKKALEIFENLYQVKYYTKISLRYQDLILRSKLEMAEQPWSKLIKPEIASELHNPLLSSSIKSLLKNLEIQLDEGTIKFSHGLVEVEDSETKAQELAYLLDSDFFLEGKIEHTKVWEILKNFNKLSGKLFRWSITDELHNALLPQAL